MYPTEMNCTLRQGKAINAYVSAKDVLVTSCLDRLKCDGKVVITTLSNAAGHSLFFHVGLSSLCAVCFNDLEKFIHEKHGDFGHFSYFKIFSASNSGPLLFFARRS